MREFSYTLLSLLIIGAAILGAIWSTLMLDQLVTGLFI